MATSTWANVAVISISSYAPASEIRSLSVWAPRRSLNQMPKSTEIAPMARIIVKMNTNRMIAWPFCSAILRVADLTMDMGLLLKRSAPGVRSHGGSSRSTMVGRQTPPSSRS